MKKKPKSSNLQKALWILILLAISFTLIGGFLWSRLFKTYEFADHNGSMRYPYWWSINADTSDLGTPTVEVYFPATARTREAKASYAVRLTRYNPTDNMTDKQEAKSRINGVIGYLDGALEDKKIYIDGQEAYSAITTDAFNSREDMNVSRYMEIGYNNHVWEIQTEIPRKPFANAFDTLLFKYILESIRLRPTAR